MPSALSIYRSVQAAEKPSSNRLIMCENYVNQCVRLCCCCCSCIFCCHSRTHTFAYLLDMLSLCVIWKISSSFQIYIHCVELEKLLLLSFVIVQFNQLLAGDFEKHFIAFPYALAAAAAATAYRGRQRGNLGKKQRKIVNRKQLNLNIYFVLESN